MTINENEQCYVKRLQLGKLWVGEEGNIRIKDYGIRFQQSWICLRSDDLAIPVPRRDLSERCHSNVLSTQSEITLGRL